MPETAEITLVTNPKTWGHLFQEEGVPASVYHAVLLHRYGTDIYAWEPETINMEIEKDFGVNPSGEVRDKIHGIISVMPIDSVLNNAFIFGNICHALNDTDPSFEMFSPVTVEEAAWASYEILLNRNEKPSVFSDEVKAYVRALLHENGYFKCPKELGWCEMSSHIDMTKFHITEEAKAVQEDKLKRVSAYVSVRKQKLMSMVKELFPNADHGNK